MNYVAAADRYQKMTYRRSGRSGIDLPMISLGLWQNFGGVDNYEVARAMLRRAFDRGVCHFDLANNYGPPYGSAEENYGRIHAADFRPYRDELFISTKAGWDMWPGPYGNYGSRKYLIASLDQSLRRMGLDYVDLFYHHRPDPDTPLEETMGALASIVKSGKALYVGVSQYQPEDTRKAATILKSMGIPLLIHQPVYSMLNRWIEDGLLATLAEIGAGCICFSPLAQGLLTDKYLKGIPEDSRAARDRYLPRSRITPELVEKLAKLDVVARRRGQSLAQMALLWVLRHKGVTSALIGARTVAQLDNSLDALKAPELSAEELSEIDRALA
ncbi:MAG TPA: aldo/keto reductase [Bauldia sp.]|nr:aldo/keto reductase [Bauldia sp.]